MKNTKGITLVALVITIIILLILAGITISQLTGSGLFENAKLAEEKSKNAQEEEESKLEDYTNKISEYVNGTRNENINYAGDCIIQISEEGIVTLQDIEGANVIAFAVVENDKCIDVIKGNTYAPTVSKGETANIYIIAIDDNAKIYKSNTVQYIGKYTYLYHKGNECTNISGGWRVSGGVNASSSHWTKKDDYMEINCVYGVRTYITTQNAIDLTKYSKLVIVSDVNNTYNSGYITTSATLSSDPYTFGITNGTTIIDISEYSGEQYVHFSATAGTLKIHEIYLEE